MHSALRSSALRSVAVLSILCSIKCQRGLSLETYVRRFSVGPLGPDKIVATTQFPGSDMSGDLTKRATAGFCSPIQVFQADEVESSAIKAKTDPGGCTSDCR